MPLEFLTATVVAFSLAWKLDAVNAIISPGGFPLVEAKAAHASLAAFLAMLPFLLPPRWRKAAWVALALGTSGLALVDTLYLRYFDAVPPVRALLYGFQALGVRHSLGALAHPEDVKLLLDPLVVAVLPAGRRPWRWAPAVALGVMLVAGLRLLGLLAAFEAHHPRALAAAWNPRYIAATVGLGTYHLVDLANTARSLAERPVSAEEVGAIATWLDRHDPDAARGALAGTARGANLIVIQVEALQQFALGLTVAGHRVTPALDALARESAYFPNLYAQTGDGNTADAEFLTNTALYPLDHGAAFVCYPRNDYASLARRLAPAGYRSVVMHANAPAFWNRYLMYPALGFTDFASADAFQQDERVGPGLSDRSFLRQGLARLEAVPQPFHATLITLSSHHPYDDTAHFLPFDAGNARGHMLGRYLQAIHYTDAQLGTFIAGLRRDGLLERSVVVVYGDHPALGREDFPDLAALLRLPAGDRLAWVKQQKVPLLIRMPGGRGSVRPAPGGQVDILPTVAHLLGVSVRGTFGRDLLGTAPARVVLRDGSLIEDGTYFDATERRSYKLADGQPVNTPVREALALAGEHLTYSNAIVKHDLLHRLALVSAAARPVP
ncbi:MAG: sulfatase [Cyanobacteria bacterium RYN_339]|nr:sulfatase [Cyanobacteria bacterium RYN_339]